MTQSYRWLAAFALLLAFGACAARAEDEDEAPPPKPLVVELLPAPHAVPVDMPVVPIAWLFQFPASSSCAVPFTPVGFTGCGSACPGCPACTCHPVALDDAPQYVVELKMMKAGEDGATACPRLTVMEGQTAKVHLHGVETTKEQSTLQMQLTMRKQGKGALLDLAVLDAMTCNDCIYGESGLRSHTETTESQCSVSFGKPHKMVLKHDADGTETSWMEVTVSEVEREERIQKTGGIQVVPAATPAAVNDSDESALEIIADVVDDVFDTIADAASALFAPEAPEETQNLRSAEYLEHPPQYIAPSQPLPLPREMASHDGACTKAGATCIPCAAAETVQKPSMHISIDATHDRKCVEMSDGKKRFKATADRLTVHDDCIQLEGDVRGESCDDSCHDCTVIKADKIVVQRKDEGLKIHIND